MAGGVASRAPSARFWRGRRVLVTGHTGFKGGWLTLWLDAMGAEVVGAALPPEVDDPRALFNAARIGARCDSRFVDIRDRAALGAVVADARPEIVFHLAAQSLVRRSIADPLETWATNVVGTANLLDALRGAPELWATLVATSDKVYANDGSGRPMVEGDALGGADPYSASKAACEHVVASHRATYRTDSAIGTVRAGNVVGGGDMAADRLIPDAIRAAESGHALELRQPGATRPWQHVLDCLAAYLLFAEVLAIDPTAPPTLNVGPTSDAPVTVGAVAQQFAAALAPEIDLIEAHEAESVEAKALALDSARARAALGWSPVYDGAAAIERTADWHRAARDGVDMAARSEADIAAHMAALAS